MRWPRIRRRYRVVAQFAVASAASGKIELYAPFAYDAALAMIAAVRKADSVDRGKIVASLPGVSVTGVTGKISFDERGDLIKPPYTLFRVEQGQWHSIRTVGGASN